jgi:hypothetical protein
LLSFLTIISPFPHSNRISFLDNLVTLQSLYRIETVMIVFEIGNIAPDYWVLDTIAT